MYEKLFNDEIVVSTYCSPQVPKTYNGVNYPDRIKKEQYELLKKCGVNLCYGQSEKMNTDTEKYAFRALKLCGEVGIKYLVKDDISLEYLGLGDKRRDFRSLSEEEKQALDARFEKSIKRYKDKKAFAGIIFCDEPGSAMFEGIKRGKAVFERLCPDKVCLINLFPYYITDRQYDFGWEYNIPDAPDPLYAPFVRTNMERYKTYFERYAETVNTNVVSYDAYPFCSLGPAKNAVHNILYEQQQYISKYCRDNGKDFWQFLQNGGGWGENENVRVTTFGDVNLQVSLALCYGAKGLQLYTGCFPNDCLIDNVEHSGVIDRFGNITEQYPMFQYAFMQVRAIQKYLVYATLKGIMKSGKDYFGLLPDEKTIAEMQDGDTVFVGDLPKEGNIEISEYASLKSVKATSQCLVGCFDDHGTETYLLVNNSPFVAADATLVFDKNVTVTYIKGTIEKQQTGTEIKFNALPAGENVLVRVEK